MRALRAITILSLLGFALNTSASQDPLQNEKKAREDLAKRLLKLSQSLDMKEAKYEESKGGGGGKNFDSNTGNSFLSNTTIHYEVESTCREWVGGQFCKQWFSPYIPEHGLQGDFSPLEGVVASEWKKRQGADGGGTYEIWQVARDGGGSNVTAEGKFDLSGITDWRLLPEVKQKVENVGEQTAIRQISLTYEDSAKGQEQGNTLPNMESLRMMASRWTKMFRNRLVSNLADMRVSDKPTEFRTNEDRPDCEAYVQAVEAQKEEFRLEARLESQDRLQPETQALSMDQRYKACMALRAASVAMVNAQAVGDKVAAGDPNQERIDKWRTRLNIAAIDQVGIDVNSLPKPGNAALTPADITTELADWEVGGQTKKGVKRMTNAQQLQSYNNNLELAAVGMKEVAMRSANVADTSEHILKHKIKPGQYNAVRLNSLTGEMREELKETSMKESGVIKGEPETQLEMTAMQLSVTRR